jgi:hypothetical protein
VPRRPPPRGLPPALVKNLAAFVQSTALSYDSRMRHDLLASSKFHHWLKSNPVRNRHFLHWNAPIFRVIYGDYDPLSIAGSLSAGGRFNIGGAQMISSKALPGINMAGCLYGASSRRCALREASDPAGRYRLFRLTPRKNFKLWNLKAVLADMNYPGLTARIDATPMSRRWVLQKSPLESQILAHHLRDIDGGGIVYDSQKDPPEGKTLAFFLRDDQEAGKTFDAAACR